MPAIRVELIAEAPARRILGWLAVASGIVSAVGVLFIIGMFVMFSVNMTSTGEKLGAINDVAILIQYLLALPLAFAVHQLVQARSPVLSIVATLIGVAGMVAVIVLQYLLVTGALTFEQQVGPVSVALLAVAAWLVVTGYLGRSTGQLPRSLLSGILGASYIGYPIWAFWLGRRLLSD